jgi:hypothetical protein
MRPSVDRPGACVGRNGVPFVSPTQTNPAVAALRARLLFMEDLLAADSYRVVRRPISLALPKGTLPSLSGVPLYATAVTRRV